MDFLNLHTSTLDDEKLATAEAGARSTWLHLTRHCIGAENGGRIANCRDWTERKWLLLCRVTPAEVQTASDLWSWEGADLVVWGYPSDKEREVKAKRRAAHASNKKRWRSESLSDTQSASLSASGREWKGMEEKGNGMETSASVSVIPTIRHLRMLAVNALKERKDGTAWSKRELGAFRGAELDSLSADKWDEQIAPLTAYYGATLPRLRQHWGKDPAGNDDFRRRDLLTLLNNWAGEVDRAIAFVGWQEKFETDRDAGRLEGRQ